MTVQSIGVSMTKRNCASPLKIDIRRGVASRFRAVRFVMPAGVTVADHRHEGWHLLLLKTGGLYESIDGGSVRMRPGDLRLSGPDAAHQIEYEESCSECIVLHIASDPSLQRLWRGGSYFAVDSVAADSIAAAFDRLGAVESVLQSDLIIREGIARVRRLASGLAPEPPAWLADAKALLSGSRLTTVEVARAVKTSREHLSRAYQEYFGCNATEFRRFGAASHAIALLSQGAGKCEAALEAGFHDQSHMTRTMVGVLGVTPGRLSEWSGREITSVQ